MNKLFCPDCGTNNSFASKKPNFCCNCGYKFASIGSTKSEPKKNDEEAIQTSKASASAEDWFEFDKTQNTVSFKFDRK